MGLLERVTESEQSTTQQEGASSLTEDQKSAASSKYAKLTRYTLFSV